MKTKRKGSEFRAHFEFESDYVWFCDQTYPQVCGSTGDVGPFPKEGFVVNFGPVDEWRIERLAEEARMDQNEYLSHLLHDTLTARDEARHERVQAEWAAKDAKALTVIEGGSHAATS